MRSQNETVDARVYQAQTQGLWMVDQGLNLPLILSQQGLGYQAIIWGLRVFGHALRGSPLWNGPVFAEDLACRSERRLLHQVQLRRIKLTCGLEPSQSSTFRVSPCRERLGPGSGDPGAPG
jgi:hypothetical protein